MVSMIDFSKLRLSHRPNQFLCLPVDYDSESKPHLRVNTFDISVEDLQNIFYSVIIKQRSVHCKYNNLSKRKKLQHLPQLPECWRLYL